MLNTYTPENPPKRGTARRLWNALCSAGFHIEELHYNPNCWGHRSDGWGTWAFSGYSSKVNIDKEGALCGIHEGRAYIQGLSAPYSVVFLDSL